jgi:hypothetical protein
MKTSININPIDPITVDETPYPFCNAPGMGCRDIQQIILTIIARQYKVNSKIL